MGWMNILWLIFNKKSNLLHLGRSPHSHLSRLKAQDDSAVSPLYWDTSHFPKLLHPSRALYRTTNLMFMTLYGPCCHIIHSQIESRSVWHCYYFRGNKVKCHKMHRWFLILCVKKSFQNWTSALSCFQMRLRHCNKAKTEKNDIRYQNQ